MLIIQIQECVNFGDYLNIKKELKLWKKRVKEVASTVVSTLLGANIVKVLRNIYQIQTMQDIADDTKKYQKRRRSRLRIDQELKSSMDSEVRIKK